jgi:predicted XRE-type DNA-binding protein
VWEVESTVEFDQWFADLSLAQQKRIVAAIEVLRQAGPGLGRPLVDAVKGSRHSNMKELRRGTLRVLFAFDPTRTAVLLVGGRQERTLARVVHGSHRARRPPVRAASEGECTEEGVNGMTYNEIAEELLSDPRHRADIEREKAAILAANKLAGLREQAGLSQSAVAEILGITQARVSRIERAEEVQLSTLQRYVEALGGRLEVRAVFEQETVEVSDAEAVHA